jgi:hypothetical protein
LRSKKGGNIISCTACKLSIICGDLPRKIPVRKICFNIYPHLLSCANTNGEMVMHPFACLPDSNLARFVSNVPTCHKSVNLGIFELTPVDFVNKAFCSNGQISGKSKTMFVPSSYANSFATFGNL